MKLTLHRLLVLCIIAALCGCMSIVRQEQRTWTACDGTLRSMPVTEYSSPVPGIDCPLFHHKLGGEWFTTLFMTIGLTLACSLWRKDYSEGWVILPPWATQWMREHEYAHFVNSDFHPPLLPILNMGCKT